MGLDRIGAALPLGLRRGLEPTPYLEAGHRSCRHVNWSMSVEIGPILPRSSLFIISHPTTDSQEATLETWETASTSKYFREHAGEPSP